MKTIVCGKPSLWVVLCTQIALFITGATHLPAQTPTISGVINTYLTIQEISDHGKKIYVDDASGVDAGDWLLVIQHQGAGSATEDECDGPTGEVTAYDAAGNFELVRVKEIDPDPPAGPYALLECIELEVPLQRFYYACTSCDHQTVFPRGNYYGVQAVVVPYYAQDVEVTGTVTAPAWDGETGGVVAMIARGRVTLKADIDVSGKGFRGGLPSSGGSTADLSGYIYAPGSNAGAKGEGISDITLGTPDDNAGRVPYSMSAGRGAIANGGGGGNGLHAGGGGGSNYGAGGRGGKQNNAQTNLENGGEGGWALTHTDQNRMQVFFGGGGGGGHRSNDDPGIPDDSKGGAGGGIVLILANELAVDNTSRHIKANGAAGENGEPNGNGAGGGGGGGGILLDVNGIVGQGSASLIVQVAGGAGGNTESGTNHNGPGGGGGGGVLRLRMGSTPAIVKHNSNGGTTSGGTKGQSDDGSTTSDHGAANGNNGAVLHNLTYPKWYATGESPI